MALVSGSQGLQGRGEEAGWGEAGRRGGRPLWKAQGLFPGWLIGLDRQDGGSAAPCPLHFKRPAPLPESFLGDC